MKQGAPQSQTTRTETAKPTWPARPYTWRALTDAERSALEQRGNTAENWARVVVADPFNHALVQRCHFAGDVRIGPLTVGTLRHAGMDRPVGLYDSTLLQCDLGANVSIAHVRHMARYAVGDGVLLFDIGSLVARPGARFGTGVGPGEGDEKPPLKILLGNENGGRYALPFAELLPADACLWVSAQDDQELVGRLVELTRARAARLPDHGRIDAGAVVVHCRTLRDVLVGPRATIDGAELLDDVTVSSATHEPTRIGAGVILGHGIVGHANRIDTRALAMHFVTGVHVDLCEGARIENAVIGDNSQIYGCEIQSVLLMPGHVQHHSSSFVIAATLYGQCNIAAGVVAGSNHNSRAPDGEIVAARGFWPGLCTSLKHNCRFASFTLLAKGDYPAELDVQLPFSLVSNDVTNGALLLMPAYWLMYNAYALGRTSWKITARDGRVRKRQHIVSKVLAPDTVEEMFTGRALLERWAGLAALRQRDESANVPDEELCAAGRAALVSGEADGFDIIADGVENSRRPVRVLKAVRAYAAYREAIHYFAVRTLAEFMWAEQLPRLADMKARFGDVQRIAWRNLGGQLVTQAEFDRLRAEIASGAIRSWDALHDEYDQNWQRYPQERMRYAVAALADITATPTSAITPEQWCTWLDEAARICQKMADDAHAARAKDFTSPFRTMTYESQAEMEAVLGRLDDDAYLQHASADAAKFARVVSELKAAVGT